MIAPGLILGHNLEHMHQYFVHGHTEHFAQRIQVIDAGEGLALLPLVDGLGCVESEILLEFGYGQSLRLP